MSQANATVTWDGTDGVEARVFKENMPGQPVSICGECHSPADASFPKSGEAPDLSDFIVASQELDDPPFVLTNPTHTGNDPIDRAIIRIRAGSMPPSDAANFPLIDGIDTLVEAWFTDGLKRNDDPSVMTNPASGFGKNNATLHAAVNDNGIEARYTFRYGIADFDSSVNGADDPDTQGGGLIADPIATPISGLACGSTYQFRVEGCNTPEDCNATNSSFGTAEVFTTTDCPTANAQSIDVDEDASRSITLSAINADSVSVFAVETQPANGTLTGSAPDLNYAPALNFNGTDSFRFSVSEEGGSSSATVTITVNPQPDAPVADNQTLSVLDGSVIPITLTGSDVDGDALMFTHTDPGQGALSGDAPDLEYTASGGSGQTSFTFQASDGMLVSAPATIEINVQTREPPTAIPQTLQVNEDNNLNITLDAEEGATGPGISRLEIAEGFGPANGQLENDPPNLVYIPNEDFFGDDSFRFTAIAEDVAGVFVSNPATINISVNPINDQPVFTTLAPATVTELDTLTINAAANLTDPDDLNDGTQLTWSLLTPPAGMSISATGIISYTPGEDTAGDYDTVVRVRDGLEDGSTVQSQALTILVNLLDTDEDTVADYNDNCPATDNLDQANLDGDALGDICDPDDDGDSINDIAELANGLDPRNASDGLADLDGDGLSNAQEFSTCLAQLDEDCLAIGVDSVAPTITVDDLTVIATGYVTDVSIDASAIDGNDGVVAVTPDISGPFRPGRYDITWTSMDTVGNPASVETTLDVLPQARLAGALVTGEGRSVQVPVTLNGRAPTYPVVLTYSLAGTAGSDDHTLIDTSVQIDAGTHAIISFEIIDDAVGEGEEQLLLTLTSTSENAAIVGEQSARILIVEDNVEPSVSVTATQAGISSQYIYKDQGEVVVTAIATDPNGDGLSFDWTATDSGLGGTANGNQYVFDASQTLPAPGDYQLGVLVSDGSTNITETLTIVVAPTAPALTATADTDNDGVDDLADGRGDTDRDGLPDFQDPVDDQTLLSQRAQAGAGTFARLIRAEESVSLALGDFAVATNRGGARIAAADITDAAGEIIADDAGLQFSGGVFDFQLRGLSRAQRGATVVLPLTQAIPVNSRYRKLANNAWSDFVESGTDSIHSAASNSDNECPPPRDPAYQPGLIAFNNCVQLIMTDGGPNDADGQANGVIRDPGGVAFSTPLSGSVNNPQPPAPPTSSPAGSGKIAWLTLLFLLCLWCSRVLRRARQ